MLLPGGRDDSNRQRSSFRRLSPAGLSRPRLSGGRLAQRSKGRCPAAIASRSRPRGVRLNSAERARDAGHHMTPLSPQEEIGFCAGSLVDRPSGTSAWSTPGIGPGSPNIRNPRPHAARPPTVRDDGESAAPREATFTACHGRLHRRHRGESPCSPERRGGDDGPSHRRRKCRARRPCAS